MLLQNKIFLSSVYITPEHQNNICNVKSGPSFEDYTSNKSSSKRTKIYKRYLLNKSNLSKIKKKIKLCKTDLKKAYKLTFVKEFRKLEQNFDPSAIELIDSQFRNCNKKRPSYSLKTKILSLAIYKRGPKCYRFLQKFFKLPSASTLHKLCANLPFLPGINDHIFNQLRTNVVKMEDKDKLCSVMFDEIAISPGFHYSKFSDQVVGYVDLGSLGKSNDIANRVLVFMIRGLNKEYKQPIAYYFTKDSIKTGSLVILLKEIISMLQNIGFKVLCTVCDQSATNVGAYSKLMQESNTNFNNPYFRVNDEKIIALHDTPHLLKSIRNALLKYNIRYDDNKFAKYEHIEKCFQIDQRRRCQALRKINPNYFNLHRNPKLKMKVKIAARLLSATVAAAIESMCEINSNLLPADAIHTAIFVKDIDMLFDSLNGRFKKPENFKPLKCGINKNSGHINFYNDILCSIESWVFTDKFNHNIITTTMPFKKGLIQTIRGIIMMWDICNKKGLTYLMPRKLNQDPVQNFFSTIRQYGCNNTNSTCHQFVSTFKSCVLNNMTSSHSLGSNCEKDEGGIAPLLCYKPFTL